VTLDNATVFRISALLYLLMPFIAWMLLGRPRKGSALLWCAGGLLAGVAVTLIGLREYIPPVWSYSVAQPMYLASFLVMAQSFQMDMQRTWRWRWLVLPVLAYAAVIAIGFDDKRSHTLAVLVRLVNCAGLSVLTASALMLARKEPSRNTASLTLGYALMTTSMLVSTMATLQGQASLHHLHTNVISLILSGVSLLTLIMSYMGYLGLTLERSLRNNMALRQAQWQSQQWQERNQALALLDRQRTLDVLANSLGHAILQPLTATLLQVQIVRRLLQTTTPNADLVQSSLTQVLQGLRRSADMVEHIRSFLRPPPANRPTGTLTLQSVVQSAHDLLRQELMYQGVTLELTVPPAAVRVQGEHLPLTQALVQILRNAMQAVQAQKLRTIQVVLASNQTQAWIEVRDSGPGFSPDAEASAQVNTVPTTDALSGMGLAMTRRILAQFQGQLSWRNHQGGGAWVRMTLPLPNTEHNAPHFLL
jgi:C4-dicarboxylate-specific signal transduction histidine kinase